MFTYRMSSEITLILHRNSKLIQNANVALEYVSGEFCVRGDFGIDLVNVWTTHELCKACCNCMKFASVYYLVPGSGLQRLENDRDVLPMWKIGLVAPKKEVHVYLEHVEPKGVLDFNL